MMRVHPQKHGGNYRWFRISASPFWRQRYVLFQCKHVRSVRDTFLRRLSIAIIC